MYTFSRLLAFVVIEDSDMARHGVGIWFGKGEIVCVIKHLKNHKK